MIVRLWVTDYGFRIPDSGYRLQITELRIIDYGCPYNFGFRIPDSDNRLRMRDSDAGLRMTDSGLLIAWDDTSRIRITSYRFRTTDYGLQITDS